jgi:hypothetical protein
MKIKDTFFLERVSGKHYWQMVASKCKQAPFRALGVTPQAAGILGGFLAGRSRSLACVL